MITFALVAATLPFSVGCPGDAPADAGDATDATDAGDGDGDPDGGDLTDAGDGDGDGDACAPGTDPDLGSLVLGSGFTKVDAATVDPGNLLALAHLPADDETTLYALGYDMVIRRLTGWPALADDGAVALSILQSGDAPDDHFASGFLVPFGERLVAGYTGAFDGSTVPGTVALLDPTGVAAPDSFDAPGNFSATTFDNKIIVDGIGLGLLADGLALYGFDYSVAAYATLVTFPGDAGGSGFTGAGDAFVVAGYFDGNFSNQAALLPTADLDGLFEGQPVASSTLSALPLPPVLNMAATATHVVTLEGSYDASFNEVQTALTAYEASDVGAGSVPVLTYPESACERVVVMSEVADDLLVVVEHADGSGHLVRLQAD